MVVVIIIVIIIINNNNMKHGGGRGCRGLGGLCGLWYVRKYFPGPPNFTRQHSEEEVEGYMGMGR